jgi:hypothetical protein
VPGLGTSFGRGGATTAQQDLVNADAILIIGSSMAEAHPVGFQWVVRARERGAHVIHVDPRYSRTSAMSDFWVPLRAGSDVVFLGGLINYVLERGLHFHEYVVAYTNAPTIIHGDFADVEGLDGLFSGWDPARGKYDTATWEYAGGSAERDATLQDPRCVFQLLKRHFARYTPEMVERACGVRREDFLEVARVFTSASGPERTAAICYAVGLTQHSTGVQVIRAAAILQLLLGNVGRPGGGVLALRGHASIQGSTDIPTLFDMLPGYLPMPRHEPNGGGRSLREYLDANQPSGGVWAATDAFLVSLLRRGTEMRPARKTISDSTGSRASRAITRTSLSGSTWRTEALARPARSRASSSWARTRPSARRTRGSSAGRWQTFAGSSCATWSKPRRRASGTTRRRSNEASCGQKTSRPRCSSSPLRATRRRAGASRIRNASFSGERRRSIRPAMPAATPGSSITSGAG